MDFNDYVNQLNQLDDQENKSELENFYSFNASLLQCFRGIDSQIKAVLNASTINSKSVELIQTQVNAVLFMLNKLKFEISMFDAATLSEVHGAKINQTIVYVQNNMTIGEVDIISNQLFDLLKKNEVAFVQEQEDRKRRAREEKERIAREEKERIAREEKERITREEKERIAREEKERIAREEKERIAREEKERIARKEKEREDAKRKRIENEQRTILDLFNCYRSSAYFKRFCFDYDLENYASSDNGTPYDIYYNRHRGHKDYITIKVSVSDDKIHEFECVFSHRNSALGKILPYGICIYDTEMQIVEKLGKPTHRTIDDIFVGYIFHKSIYSILVYYNTVDRCIVKIHMCKNQ